jgi:outer membrane protein assembly factor BamB
MRGRPLHHHQSRSVFCFMLGLLMAATLIAACSDPKVVRCPARSIWVPVFFPVPSDAACTGAWLTFGFNTARSEVNPGETIITPATAGQLHRLWTHQLPQVADSTPVLLPGLTLPDGTTRDILYLTTKTGGLVALDAATGAQLWTQTTITNPDPNKMTTSSPVADPFEDVIYSYGLDGKLHRYRATTGQEMRGAGWPVKITTMPASEKESSALNAANGFIYVTTAGYAGDAPPYQGHVVVINPAQGTSRVFNSLCARRAHLLAPGECAENGAGIWGRAGAVVDPTTGNIFVTTGNGPYTANRGGDDWGDSVLELTADGARLVDAYTPTDPDGLYTQDLDLGSASPALLPAILSSKTSYLAVQAGKEGLLRLLNRRNLSGQGGPGHLGGELQTLDAPDHCPVLTQPAVWTDPAGGAIWVFVSNSCAIGGYQVITSSQGVTRLHLMWSVGIGATSPLVAGGVLFAATANNGLVALDPSNGRRLWSSADPAAGGNIGAIHWESPIVAGGRLYCADENGQITAYGL